MWTAKDFMDTPTKDTHQTSKATKGKWSASDFENDKPSQQKVVAHSDDANAESIYKIDLKTLNLNNKKSSPTPFDYYSLKGEGTEKNNAMMLGGIDTATLGGANLINKKVNESKGKTSKTVFDKAKEEHPGYYKTGEMLGYIPSGIAFDKLAGKAITGLKVGELAEGATKAQKVANVLQQAGKQALTDALAGTGMATTESALRGEGTKQMMDRVKVNALLGAGIGGLTKGIGAGLKVFNPEIVEDTLKSSTLPNGKYKIKSGKMYTRTATGTSQIKNIHQNTGTAGTTTGNGGIIINPLINRIRTDLGLNTDVGQEMMNLMNKPINKPTLDINPIGIRTDNKIKVGDYVKAKDQNNFGRVVGIDGDGNYKVSFKNKKTGGQATVTLNEYQLQSTNKNKYSIPQNKPINEIPTTAQTLSQKPIIQNLPKPSSKIVSSKSTNTSTISQRMQKAYTKLVDNQSPLTQFSKVANDNTNIIASNSRNAGGTVDYIIKDALVDKNGKQIGESFQNIMKDIPKDKQESFWEYALHKHNIARTAQNKPIYTNYTKEMSEKAYKELEKVHPEFKQVSDRLNKYMKDFTKAWGVDTGTIDKTLMDSLNEMYPHYVPTNRAFNELEGASKNVNKKGFVNHGTPIKKATGSERDIINPAESIMNLVNKTVRTARYNQVGQSLVESLRKNPEELKQFAEIIPTNQDIVDNINKTLKDEGIDGLVMNFADQFDEVASKGHLKGGNIVTVMENGKPIQVKVNNKELLDTLTGLYKSNSTDLEKLARKTTGAFKALVTHKNPLFAIRNLARDLPTAYINGSEDNPLKFLRNYGKAYKHILSNDEVYKQYKAVGGQQSNFFSVDKVADAADNLTKKKNILHKIGDSIETLNNATESAPRLAEFEKVYKDTGDINKALNAANEVTVNFARGGNTTKQIDNIVPYLNAGVQGLDKILRQVKSKPLQTLAKGAISITAPSIALYEINKNNPNYQNLDNRTKDNYYLIPKDDGTFTKIPKSRELGVLFGSLFERIARQNNGEDEAWKGFAKNAKTNISPADPFSNNIFSPIYNLASNKDFADRPIVPANLQKLSPQYQYDEKTSEIAKKIGEIANLSPKQIDYLIKSYTGVIGQVGLPLATKGADVGKSITTQFTADPLYSNEALNTFYENIDKLEKKAADKNFIEKIPSKVVTPDEMMKNLFLKASKQITEINKKIKELQAANAKANESKIREYQQQKIDIANKMNSMLK